MDKFSKESQLTDDLLVAMANLGDEMTVTNGATVDDIVHRVKVLSELLDDPEYINNIRTRTKAATMQSEGARDGFVYQKVSIEPWYFRLYKDGIHISNPYNRIAVMQNISDAAMFLIAPVLYESLSTVVDMVDKQQALPNYKNEREERAFVCWHVKAQQALQDLDFKITEIGKNIT